MSSCVNSPDIFCYICGQFEVKEYRKTLTESLKKIYLECFGIPIKNQNQTWVPHIACSKCSTLLNRWKQGNVNFIGLKEPMKWREPKSHDDCYFCQTNVFGFNHHNKCNISYAKVSSVTFPKLKDATATVKVKKSDSKMLLQQHLMLQK